MPELRLSQSVVSHLCRHRWPGKVRQLESAIERLIVLASGTEITELDLPGEFRAVAPERDSFLLEMPEEGVSLEAVERELLVRALEKFQWNQTQAARYLDISRRTLIYRIEKHKLVREGVSS